MGLSQTRIYRAWRHMMKRCYSAKNDHYYLYGARGISVCERWHKFQNFYEDMHPVPDKFSLDRIDCNLGYSPENCRWADIFVQANNKRNSDKINVNGASCTVTEAARNYGVSYSRLKYLISLGRTPENAIAALKESPNGLVKTKCKRGHEYSPQNTTQTKLGHRLCRACGELRRLAKLSGVRLAA